MIQKFFNIIFRRYLYKLVENVIKRAMLQPLIRGNSKNITIGKDTVIRENVELECLNGTIEIGNNCFLLQNIKIMCYGGNIKIGNDVSINPFCILYGHGNLTIGNNVRIANSSVFIPSNHNFQRTDIPIWHQGETSKGIILEDDIWIGTNVKVLDGVKISKGIIVGAGSVVTKSLNKEFGIYAGVPAKFIKYRYE
ncbi:acyltransferase [Faecalibacter sp. LW9]|uniref:acyltransferase n=1 Tax=Faecalibacter sp. LW9 TaxID=3103144 RepID=UPI002AFEDE27|nr:acyltransferase [Faecalibacter sp. LW9]